MGLFGNIFNKGDRHSIESLMSIGNEAIYALQNEQYQIAATKFSEYFENKSIAKFTELDEDDGLMLYNFSIALFNIGKCQDAIITVTKALLREKFHQAYEVRAQYYSKLKNHEDAIRDLSTCIQLNPNNRAHYLVQRGKEYLQAGNKKDSIVDIVSAYELGNTEAKELLRENTNYFNR